MQQALKNNAEPVKQCPVRVYGLQGHSSYLAIDLPDEMLQEGEVFGYQEKFYQVCSVLKDSEDHFCLNVNSIVETLSPLDGSCGSGRTSAISARSIPGAPKPGL